MVYQRRPKPPSDAHPIEHLLHGLAEIDDERQESCIHCRKVWYVIHHVDGVCDECQRKGLPGRMQIAEAVQRRDKIIAWIAFAIFLTLLLWIRSLAEGQ